MRSPVLAMLWENWRLIRLEAAWRLSLGVVGGSAVLVLFAAVAPTEGIKDFGATIALVLIVLPQFPLWLSIAKLNGGRFVDGYRPGFPLYLLYTRPVRTAVLVGVPMAFLAASAAALYLVSALVLRVTFGYPFPLLPVAAWIAAVNLIQMATNWSTRNKVMQLVETMVATSACVLVAVNRVHGEEIPGNDFLPDRWPAQFDFPLADYALMAAISLASVGVTIAGVARQRHGDAPAMLRTANPAGLPDWLINLFRFPCPTSSATRAQVWFDLKASGLPVLTIALAVAVAIPLLYAVSGPVAFVRPYATMFAGFAVLAVLFLGGNAFGVRRRQGRTYASVFDATQAYGTARLAGLKVLVRALCMLTALIVVGASMWASLSLVSGWGEVPREAAALLQWRHAIEAAVGALTGYQQAALAVVMVIGVAVMVASRAVLGALWARYPRRMMIAGSLPLLYGLAFVLRALAGPGGNGSEVLLDALFRATPWIAAAAIVLATVYLFRRSLVERLLTLRQACGATLVSVAFGVAWVAVLRAAGVQLAAMPTTDAVWMLSPMLLPLTASALAPWSLSRIRHT